MKRRFLELEQKGVTRGENKYERTHHCKETAPNELVSSQSCAVHPTFDPPTKHLSANKRYISRVVRHVRVSHQDRWCRCRRWFGRFLGMREAGRW